MPPPLSWLLGFISVVGALSAEERRAVDFRGGKVEWARLKTDGPYWNRHAEFDRDLLQLMCEETSLNIETEGYSTSAHDLEDLCTYPFIFTDSLAWLSERENRNLGEYLRRGGFLLIDACLNAKITPSPEEFYRVQIKRLKESFPNLRVIVLRPGHEIFSSHFKMKECPPQTRSEGKSGPTIPLHALLVDGRMIAILSLSGLQCGWAQFGTPDNATACMQMVTNIYVYAITR